MKGRGGWTPGKIRDEFSNRETGSGCSVRWTPRILHPTWSREHEETEHPSPGREVGSCSGGTTTSGPSLPRAWRSARLSQKIREDLCQLPIKMVLSLRGRAGQKVLQCWGVSAAGWWWALMDLSTQRAVTAMWTMERWLVGGWKLEETKVNYKIWNKKIQCLITKSEWGMQNKN